MSDDLLKWELKSKYRRNMDMRRMIIFPLLFLFALTGCVEVKDAVQQELTIQQAVERISKIVDKRNGFQTQIDQSPEVLKYESLTEQFDQSLQMENPDMHLVDQIIVESAKIQNTLKGSKVTLQEVDVQAKEMKTSLTGKLSPEDHTAVQKTLDDLIHLITSERIYTDILLKQYKMLDQQYMDIKNAKESSKKDMIQIETELLEAEKKLDQQVNAFNESWNAIHKDVHGTNLEEGRQ